MTKYVIYFSFQKPHILWKLLLKAAVIAAIAVSEWNQATDPTPRIPLYYISQGQRKTSWLQWEPGKNFLN